MVTTLIWLGLIAGAILLLAKTRASLRSWTIGVGAVLFLTWSAGWLNPTAGAVLTVLWALIMVPINFPVLRQRVYSAPMMKRINAMLPPMSQTERDAIEAGTVGWDAELFGGDPHWNKLLDAPASTLTAEEQAFLDGPVNELCAMLQDWEITHERNDLPEDAWEFIKKNRFLGMIIPKEYGGMAFSARAHSEVVMKVGSRSGTAGVSVMVPNSLGPAELLLHYGTQAQKDHYLPRLAVGEEIPCFALTAPTAGSDAGAIPDTGIVCMGEFEGEQVLGMRLTWAKRYITLGPIATVLGLAFKAYDPDHLLGEAEELGITCALIPTETPGVEIGNRHYPLNAAFMNGPNSGENVFIPMDWIIGGAEQVGNGWRMLMESLSVGRGISLPSTGAAGGKFAAWSSGAYSRVREQFGMPIGKFEGISEVLARIGGLTYAMDAARLHTLAALDAGEKPSVISAIMKLNNTEGVRQTVNDAMDIHGGKGICMGPNNYLARAYQQIPISITVEGANILTRSLIIFGQGAMRCHPYLLAEIESAGSGDLKKFDRALFGHIGHVIRNKTRAFVFGLSRGRLAGAPVSGPTARYYGQVEWLASGFAYTADVAFLMLGGALKRKESLSGRFADVLGQLYFSTAILKRYEDTGRPESDLPVVHWALQDSLYKAQEALMQITRNFPVPGIGLALRMAVFPMGRRLQRPDDKLSGKVAALLMTDSPTRQRLVEGIYINQNPEDVTGQLEVAFRKVLEVAPIRKTLRKAGYRPPQRIDMGDGLDEWVSKGVISDAQLAQLRAADAAVAMVVAVDDFPQQEQVMDSSATEAA